MRQLDIMIGDKNYKGDVINVHQSLVEDIHKTDVTSSTNSDCRKLLKEELARVREEMTTEEHVELGKIVAAEYKKAMVQFNEQLRDHKVCVINILKKNLKFNRKIIIVYWVMIVFVYFNLIHSIAYVELIHALCNVFIMITYVVLLKNEYKEMNIHSENIVIDALKI